MDRREFLSLAAGLAPVAWTLPARAAPSRTRLLVLVELKGGNDGLNTVVPLADPAYRRLRPRIAVARDSLLAVSDAAGLHPSLGKLMPLWTAGELAIVQGLGYPDPSLSHFRSIEIWDTASGSGDYLESGWLSRAFGKNPSPAGFAADGVVVGSADLGPLSGPGVRAIALTDPEDFLRSARLARALDRRSANTSLAHILKVERDIAQSAERLGPGRELRTAFPAGPFGGAIRTAARLAANPQGVSVIRVSLSGFDTHASQPGTHEALLRQLGDGLSALRAALEETGRWADTLVATYSEFGRRPKENASAGTDHGTASVHFVMGGPVKGGLYGVSPRLDRLDGQGNLEFTVDFRRYYATLLEGAWGGDRASVLGGDFEPLGFVRARA